ncbi:phosphate acetyltransferase [Gardnerella vaginalis]|uniref:Phosphate acetyltransferase n=1 Tax=Gardnerella piotii TaxID=2792977 RepID=A0ABU5MR81_9BIFI|nr:phosphate acetyltransferase [Gardnerella piotii]MDZ7544952.1 phosphate acetyltransferase [Gardnerella piotii]MDZ7552802.1 phosphate acetyltransferase [Gardnerella piotii]RFT26410.1 phosphate acetyltransferase [Gardnerella vaginalis]
MSLVNVTIISADCAQSRNVVALGVTKALSNHYSTTVFRPSAKHDDAFTSELIAASNTKPTLEQVIAACPCAVRKNKDTLRGDIVASYNELISATNAQGCVIVASDSTSVFDPDLFRFDASVAADLASPVFLSVCAEGRDSKQILQTIEAQCASVSKEYTKVFGVFVTDCKEDLAKELKEDYAQSNNGTPLWTLPSISESESDKFNDYVADEEIINALQQPFAAPTTPYAFQYSLLGKAKANKKTIVLPEGEEDRILKAADYLLERDIVNLIIVGERESILARAQELGLKSLNKASFQSMSDEEILGKMISKLCELRAKKGMTEDQAREQLKDASYFGTMLVVLGLADGLVSGSVNSTANTVRPALQVIKTKPGSKLVSGAFIMCFKDHVAVFADCAINLNPDAQQLADIALQSAQTAKAFGLDPKVGMLSYSTLGSGKGPDVDLVEEATKIVKESDPDLKVVGSIQFDAAWSETVAASKAKGNDVAGHVNVFVFPDLCAGNIGYKAVQRSSGALAVGPILQGLNKPVNDLSRGALVQDIINTVALTALEAQF